MEKEQWKDEVMSSLRGIKRAEANPFLFTRIEERIKSPSAFFPGAFITLPKLSLVFAGIALLGALNVFVLNNLSSNKSGNGTNVQSAYSLTNINYQLY